jgi:uncharacterized protein YkwD
MQRRLAHLLLAAVMSAGLLASTAAAANNPIAVGGASALERTQARQAALRGGCSTGLGLDAPAAAQESAMLCLVSEARGQHGLTPLVPSTSLRQSAVEKGGDLLRCNEFSHTACGREFSFWIRDTGYMSAECWRVGENLAWGVDEQGTVGSIFRAWMRSPTHRANILGDFEETGIDLRVGPLGGLTGVHIWTQHFGSHCAV